MQDMLKRKQHFPNASETGPSLYPVRPIKINVIQHFLSLGSSKSRAEGLGFALSCHNNVQSQAAGVRSQGSEVGGKEALIKVEGTLS